MTINPNEISIESSQAAIYSGSAEPSRIISVRRLRFKVTLVSDLHATRIHRAASDTLQWLLKVTLETSLGSFEASLDCLMVFLYSFKAPLDSFDATSKAQKTTD